MANEDEFDDVQLDDTTAGSKVALADDSGVQAAAEAQNRSAERPVERPAESKAEQAESSSADVPSTQAAPQQAAERSQTDNETGGGGGGSGGGGGGGGGSTAAGAGTMIGGSIVGDVLYSIATGEEEGRSRARILAFAAKRYQTAVDRNPKDYDALYNWALVLQESADNCGPEAGLQGKDALLEEACRKYQAATDLSPTLHEAFYNWAIAISDRAKIRGRTAEAEALWKEACDKYECAVQLNWDSPQALNNWGLALQELGTIVPAREKRVVIRKAINKFRAAIRLRYDFHRAIYNLGTVLYGLAEDTAKAEKARKAAAASSGALLTTPLPSSSHGQGQSQSHSQLLRTPSSFFTAQHLYAQSAVYIAAAHALKVDYPVYRNALRLVRTMLPLPYVKGGYLTVPPAGNSLAPHCDWLRRWFVLDQEGLREGKKPEPKQPHGNLSARRASTPRGSTGTSVAASIITPGQQQDSSKDSATSADGKAVDKKASGTAEGAAASAAVSVGPLLRVDISQVVSVEACADLSLPPGGGILIDTVEGPLYMVADDWEAMDSWVDAIRLVYTVHMRGKSEELLQVLVG